MTVQELINELEKIEDKEQTIYVPDYWEGYAKIKQAHDLGRSVEAPDRVVIKIHYY